VTAAATEATPTTDREWINVGTEVLPEKYRPAFLTLLAGEDVDRFSFDGITPRWESPQGPKPFSPGYALRAVITEFGLTPVTQVSYNLAWECHDTTLRPGYAGGYTATLTVLGVRTRKQTLWFIDGIGGDRVYPVLIETDGPHEFIPEQ
jgi:hypothetical protein